MQISFNSLVTLQTSVSPAVNEAQHLQGKKTQGAGDIHDDANSRRLATAKPSVHHSPPLSLLATRQSQAS
jgi:hypothetical protein